MQNEVNFSEALIRERYGQRRLAAPPHYQQTMNAVCHSKTRPCYGSSSTAQLCTGRVCSVAPTRAHACVLCSEESLREMEHTFSEVRCPVVFHPACPCLPFANVLLWLDWGEFLAIETAALPYASGDAGE
jgi:hypothetical protein